MSRSTTTSEPPASGWTRSLHDTNTTLIRRGNYTGLLEASVVSWGNPLVITNDAACAMRTGASVQRGTRGTVGRRRHDLSHIELSIVVPAYNEAERLPDLLGALRTLWDFDDVVTGLGPLVAGISVVRVLHAANSSRPITSFFNSSSPGTVVRT